jgi:O-methyltransferase domain
VAIWTWSVRHVRFTKIFPASSTLIRLAAAEFDMGKWMDLNMMAMTTGRERTAAEFRNLFERAGFGVEQIVPTPSPLSIIVEKPLARSRRASASRGRHKPVAEIVPNTQPVFLL